MAPYVSPWTVGCRLAGAVVWTAMILVLMVLAVDAKTIWSSVPADGARIIRESFPVGNGQLGAMSFGQPGQEKLTLNIDSLWSGGPFESTTYTGGNPTGGKSQFLNKIRENIFNRGVGNMTQMLGTNNHYGSYRVLANVTVQIEGIDSYKNFTRSLDLSNGMHTTQFLGRDGNTYTSVTYCSFPAKVCIYRISSTSKLPNVIVSLENRLTSSNLYKLSCAANQIRMVGHTKEGEPKGMEYDVMVRLSTGPLGMPMSSCATNHNGTIVVTGSAYGKDLVLNSFSVVIGAMTNYDSTKGNLENKFSFRGQSPGPLLEKTTASASTKIESKLSAAHLQDYQRLMSEFSIELFDPWKGSKYPSESLQFAYLLDRYKFTAGVSSGARKRDVVRPDVANEKKAGRGGARSVKQKRVAQFQPPMAQPNSWSSAEQPTQTTAAAQFPFPTQLAPGVTPTGAIPWHSNGLATATGDEGKLYTVTLSKTQAALPTPIVMAEADSERLEKPLMEVEEVERFGGSQEEGPDPTSAQGDPYVEALLFDYARHLFISSSREDSLPPNLQGIWQDSLESAWGGDYHANINLQMNHWFADQTGLGALQQALWNYIKNTWVPRGTETAKLLYGAPGWVVHDEMNIFGHTGMKNTATWANYPAAGAWMMQHVFDHWDYSRDLNWLQNTGYNLLREVSSFWVTQLVGDRYSKDNTLVVSPCNSPEKGPTTFGCTNYQQIISQLFMNTITAADAVNDPDTFFISSLNNAQIGMDEGLHFSAWGGLKEFKLPDSMGFDMQGDKHRHMSHLVGWYPGYQIASYLGGYGNSTIERAVAQSLRSRGSGTADGNTGWAKVWRAAAWARLNDTQQADYHLRLAIASNIGHNGLSIYDGANGPFQIDANFGIAAAMLSMLVVDMPQPFPKSFKRRVVLGPAIPSRWGPGKIKGLRIRGGTILDMSWNNRGVVDKVSINQKGEPVQFLSKEGKMIGQI